MSTLVLLFYEFRDPEGVKCTYPATNIPFLLLAAAESRSSTFCAILNVFSAKHLDVVYDVGVSRPVV